MSLSSSQCSIDGPSNPLGSRDFVFVKRENSVIGLGLLHIPDSGKGDASVVWTNMELPASLRKEMIAKVELVKKLPTEPCSQLEHLVKLGGELGYHELCFGVVYTSQAVIWASSSGIVVLSRQNGTVLQNLDTFVGTNRLWVDEAKCAIVVDNDNFELNTKRGGVFIADCHREAEQLLVYFNGVETIILSSPHDTGIPALVQRIPYDPLIHKLPSNNPSKVKVVINTANQVQITLNGIVFL
jgi:hypothetical protein